MEDDFTFIEIAECEDSERMKETERDRKWHQAMILTMQIDSSRVEKKTLAMLCVFLQVTVTGIHVYIYIHIDYCIAVE